MREEGTGAYARTAGFRKNVLRALLWFSVALASAGGVPDIGVSMGSRPDDIGLKGNMHARAMLQTCGSGTTETGRWVGSGCSTTLFPGTSDSIAACEEACDEAGYSHCAYKDNQKCRGFNPNSDGACAVSSNRAWKRRWESFEICSGSTEPTTDPPTTPPSSGITPLPIGAAFDYQIGGAYTPPAGTQVVSRDWYDSDPLTGADTYSICYVNAFQTQPDSSGSRPDLTSNWPPEVVITDLEDPEWGGEFLIDISTAALRSTAAQHVQQMIQTCADKGYNAVEFDNLDTFTRYDTAGITEAHAVEYATLLVTNTHALGLAAAQKNTVELVPFKDAIGFDFAVVEQCGEYNECGEFSGPYNQAMVGIEYSAAAFDVACGAVGGASAIVLRDVEVTAPGSSTYVIDQCGP